MRVEIQAAIGKEVIVDPTDTDEGLTAEMLSATEVLIYENATEKLEALRTKIRATGVKLVARASGVSRSEIQAIVNEGRIPHESTIAKLEAVLDGPGNWARSGRSFLALTFIHRVARNQVEYMNNLKFNRAVGPFAAAALLAGCGATQPPLGVQDPRPLQMLNSRRLTKLGEFQCWADPAGTIQRKGYRPATLCNERWI